MRWKPQILLQYDNDIQIEEEPEAVEGVKDQVGAPVEAEQT